MDRGANLDTIDVPLNNRAWLKQQIRRDARRLTDEAERLQGIDEIVNWTDPGPGGFYDDLGNLTRAAAPGARRGISRRIRRFWNRRWSDSAAARRCRSSWWTHAESLVDAPLQMHYDDLDPAAQYKIRVVYAGDSPTRKIRLEADGVEVHPLMEKPRAGEADRVRHSRSRRPRKESWT